mmetsp:Transcript_26092/g.73120  ORF Transcript_26092/g.73120 Transcript_26092/m.73120 type:complete len:80 (-) Transcript_26092:892-1131(-)
MDTGHLLSQSQEIEIQVFPMDAEILFSTSPFAVVDRGITVRHTPPRDSSSSSLRPSPLTPLPLPITLHTLLVYCFCARA